MQDPTKPGLRLPEASVLELRAQVEAILQDRALLQQEPARAVREVVYRLDRGELRVAERTSGPERWIVHGWIQQSISLYFALAPLETYQAGDLEFHDKLPPKRELATTGVRVVPPGVVRYGAHVEKGAIVMPGYVNIGARVGAGTMVDTWATVGSRCIVVEGCLVEEEAVLGAGVVLTASTPIYDVTGPQERVSKGRVPARSIVIPGMRPRRFPAGEYLTPCALIIGQRGESTDQKTSLNQALRDFGVSA